MTGGRIDENYVTAKYDYQSQGSHELDIKKGERLQLLDDSKQWWRVVNKVGNSGYVPSNYVKREKTSIFDRYALIRPNNKMCFRYRPVPRKTDRAPKLFFTLFSHFSAFYPNKLNIRG